jgi:hypothetical protein
MILGYKYVNNTSCSHCCDAIARMDNQTRHDVKVRCKARQLAVLMWLNAAESV